MLRFPCFSRKHDDNVVANIHATGTEWHMKTDCVMCKAKLVGCGLFVFIAERYS